MRLRLSFLLVSFLLLAGCSKITSDPAQVFEAAFATQPPQNVAVLNGYRMEQRRFFVRVDAMWRLHLSGPGAKDFIEERWPDLEAGIMRSYVQGSQTPWFAPGREVKYVTLVSRADPAVMIMMTPDADDVYIAYDDL